MTYETEHVLKSYLEHCKDEISRNKGYLFMKPGKRRLRDTFAHKIIKDSRKLEDPTAHLDFTLRDGIYTFKLKNFRKFFLQETERRAEKKGMATERVFVTIRKIMGHRPSNDVHRMNYGKIGPNEMWEYYRRLYYGIRVLTDTQRAMFGIEEECEECREDDDSWHFGPGSLGPMLERIEALATSNPEKFRKVLMHLEGLLASLLAVEAGS